MPNRVVKEKILRSPTINKLSGWAEVLYFHLLLRIDDFGCFDADPQLVRNECFPARPAQQVSVSKVARWLDELEQVGSIARYKVNGRVYLLVFQWETRMRAKYRKYPAPPAELTERDCQLTGKPPSSAHGVGVGVGDGVDIKRSISLYGMAFDFEARDFVGITDKDKSAWAEAYPAVDIPGEILRAVEWQLANPDKRKRNYRRFLTNWFARSQERGGTRSPQKQGDAETPAQRAKRVLKDG